MRKNYFLSLLLLMIAFWNVEAKGREISRTTPPAPTADSVNALNTPTNIISTYVTGSGSQLNVGWSTNNTESIKYQIAYSVDGVNFNYYTTDAFTTYGAFHFNGLTPNKQYWFSVRAAKDTLYAHTRFAACGTDSSRNGIANDSLHRYSCWSALYSVTTQPDLPFAPGFVGVADGYSQRSATVVFKDASDNETKFIIKRSMNDGPWVDVAFIDTPNSSGKEYNVSYVDNTLQPNSKYQYQVASWNTAGYSATATFGPVFHTLPDPPQAPSALISPWQTLNEVRLEWVNHDPNVLELHVERSFDGVYYTEISGNVPFYFTGYIDFTAAEGTTYFYRVRGRNTGGFSQYTEALQVTTPKRVGPPYDLQAKSITPTRVDLRWTNPGYGPYEIPKFNNIHRSSTNAGEGYTQVGTVVAGDTSFTDLTASPKVTYWYRIIASNDQGPSPYSNIATVLTLGPPSAPSTLEAVKGQDNLGGNLVNVTWVDNSNDEEFFILERATDDAFTQGLLITNLLANKTAAVSIPIEEGVTYFYRIKATNQYGESGYTTLSSVATVYTIAPNKPYALKATATNATTIALRWSDDSNKEENFVIERSADGTTFTGLATVARNTVAYNDATATASTKYWYRVKAVNPKGSSDFSNVATVTSPAVTNAVAFIANPADNWVVYPNPTTDAVKLVLPENMQNNAVVVTVIDRMNREVIKTKLDGRQKEHVLDLSNFAEGTYTISVRSAENQISKRVYKY